MSDMFSKKKWYISEHTGFSKLHEAYAILDPQDGKKPLGEAVEEIGAIDKFKKLFLDRGMIPLHVSLQDVSGKPLLKLDRAGCAWFSPIEIRDAGNEMIGSIRQVIFSLGGELTLSGPHGEPVGTVKPESCCGKKYTFADGSGRPVGTIVHQWKSYSRELLTSVDDWMVELAADQAQTQAPLLVAAALTVDLLFHEN
ncbi:MAG: phospholipid scramblase-related protein [Candidatus Ozemobacteraceae bacterium]